MNKGKAAKSPLQEVKDSVFFAPVSSASMRVLVQSEHVINFPRELIC